jgi:hypothetical protein
VGALLSIVVVSAKIARVTQNLLRGLDIGLTMLLHCTASHNPVGPIGICVVLEKRDQRVV